MTRWSITQSTFKPALSEGGYIDVPPECDARMLAEVLIADHQARSLVNRKDSDYRVENYGDEIAIYLTSPAWRTRKILNLQFEG
jgi:hypothetical protein